MENNGKELSLSGSVDGVRVLEDGDVDEKQRKLGVRSARSNE